MANEAVLVTQFMPPVNFTIANGTAGTNIERGTILQLSTDPRTVTASSGDNQTFAGILAGEKIGGDGKTTCPVHIAGIFRVKDSGAGVTIGDLCKIAGANLVATADDAGAQGANEIVGKALETAAASETFLIQVGIY